MSTDIHRSRSRALLRAASRIQSDADAEHFSECYDPSAPPVGLDMAGHDRPLLGPKVVVLDAFVVDLLDVDTSAQTFRPKFLLNMDWEDDGTIEPETKAKRKMGNVTRCGGLDESEQYRTGKYKLKSELQEDPLALTWNPEVVLVNAVADEDPIESGSSFHSVQILGGRAVVSRSVLYQPECRCEFTFANFPFDETDLVVKFTSSRWSAEDVEFLWSSRIKSGPEARGRATRMRRESSILSRGVDQAAVGGIGLSEFEIIDVRVEIEEKDVHSMQRYDNAAGAFGQANLVIRVRRDPYSYLLRVASVASLLMFLEVLSFFVDTGDGSAEVDLASRFSISGTVFLAMVGLYGEMADTLPKVSVVTRVDKWHLANFVLLFASNVENLAVFLLRNIVSIKRMERIEILFGILYLVMVVINLIWFLRPLRHREEWAIWNAAWEDGIDSFKEKSWWLVGVLRDTRAWLQGMAARAVDLSRTLRPKKRAEEPRLGEHLVEETSKPTAPPEEVPHPPGGHFDDLDGEARASEGEAETPADQNRRVGLQRERKSWNNRHISIVSMKASGDPLYKSVEKQE